MKKPKTPTAGASSAPRSCSVKKSCGTCKHVGKPFLASPCLRCTVRPPFSNWESKT